MCCWEVSDDASTKTVQILLQDGADLVLLLRWMPGEKIWDEVLIARNKCCCGVVPRLPEQSTPYWCATWSWSAASEACNRFEARSGDREGRCQCWCTSIMQPEIHFRYVPKFSVVSKFSAAEVQRLKNASVPTKNASPECKATGIHSTVMFHFSESYRTSTGTDISDFCTFFQIFFSVKSSSKECFSLEYHWLQSNLHFWDEPALMVYHAQLVHSRCVLLSASW